MGRADGRTFNLWEVLSGFTSVMSVWFQANTSAFSVMPVAIRPSLSPPEGNWHRYTCLIRQRLWAAGGL